MQKTDGAGLTYPVKVARLTKTVEATGEVFEVVESAEDQPARVTFRRPGLAPIDSYAMGIPLGPPIVQPGQEG